MTARLYPVAEVRFPQELRAGLKPLTRGNLLNIEKMAVPLIKQAFENYMRDVVEDVIAQRGSRSKSGRLDRALRAGVKVTGTKLDSIRGMYRGTIYASVLEYGKTIKPRHASDSDFGPQLAIPLPPAMRPDGSLKLGGPRAWKRFGTFTYVSKRTGQAYLAYKNAANRLVLLFMFIPEAKIKPSLNLRATHRRNIDQLARQVGEIMFTAMTTCDVAGYAFGTTNALRPDSSAMSLLSSKLLGGSIRKRF